MGIREGSTKYILERSFKYSVTGEQLQAEYIELFEPSHDHTSEYMKLKQMIARAQMDLVKRTGQLEKTMDEGPVAGEEVKSFKDNVKSIEDESEEMEALINVALMSSDTVDAAEFVKTFKKMACKTIGKSVCVVDGVQEMTAGLWGRLHPEEAFNIALRWCSFFAIASEGASRSISEPQQESVSLVKAV